MSFQPALIVVLMIFTRIALFFKSLVLLTAVALVSYALVPGATLELLFKLLALAVGVSLASPFVYPHVRGVRKGDDVLVFAESESAPLVGFSLKNGVALENGRIGSVISVGFPDGTEARCELTNYAGLLTPARGMVSQKAFEVEVR